jgi:hypothetical protein
LTTLQAWRSFEGSDRAYRKCQHYCHFEHCYRYGLSLDAD